jgi:Uma2 family endonuclease
VPEVAPAGYAAFAPDLAIEVLAQDDHPARTLAKIAQWLEAGARLVWAIDSERRTARVYRADGTEAFLAESNSLDGEDVLPGFSCQLSEVL